MASGINISEKTISEWVDKKALLERNIAALEEELTLVSRRLEAANLLGAAHVPKVGEAHINGHAATAVTVSKAPATRRAKRTGASMTDVIVQLVNASDSALSKKDLRSKLLERGFKEDQLGPYLYTAVTRLQKRRVIRALPDGRSGRISPL